jgi:hypothetical protein
MTAPFPDDGPEVSTAKRGLFPLSDEAAHHHASPGYRVKAIIVQHPKHGRGFTWDCSVCGVGEGHWCRSRSDVRDGHAEHVATKW